MAINMKRQKKGIWWLAGGLSVVALIMMALAIVVMWGRYESFRIVETRVGTPYSSSYQPDIGVILPGPNDGIIVAAEPRTVVSKRDQQAAWARTTSNLNALATYINSRIEPVDMGDD